MKPLYLVATVSLLAISGLAVRAASSTDSPPAPAGEAQSATNIAALEAAVPENPLKDAYFGETHVHTSYSLDAYIGGNRNGPEEAYRFARGEEILINSEPHRLKRPLDFAAVTDHAEYLGEMFSTQNAGAPGYDNPLLVELRGLKDVAQQRAWFLKYVVENNRSGVPKHPPFFAGPGTTESAWAYNREITDRYYQPGRFTTLHGYEWTAAPGGGNMHRNILFRSGNVPAAPFSAIESSDEEKLWAWIAAQRSEGRQLFAIPHNSNGSKTMMFEPVDNSGKPITAEYARARASMEPLIEMMQIKGNSEVNRKFWAADEFADFENADSMANFSGRVADKRNYVRWAIINGLAYQKTLGANPWKYGLIGGTDNHNSGAGDTAENDYVGSHGPADSTPQVRRTGDIDGWIAARDSNPGGLAGVWATKNTRGAIWDAMAARETFATSGTRIRVRFFGGPALGRPANERALVEQGYKRGVPMGGTLKRSSRPPTFTVWAAKDPDGANLDRIQIIKGWADASGRVHEKIIDVVWSGNRKRGADGKVPAVGDTVDLKTATYRNSIGAPLLMGSWTDPAWRPEQQAVYYVRVLEIPTPRWTTYDAVRKGLPLLKDVPATIQERAWASPIWYQPG